MENEVITLHHERVKRFFLSLEKLVESIERLTGNYKPTLNGEHYLTDSEVSERLKISRRTLQDYRNEGKIAYYHIGGKVLYKESDIEKMLNDSYFSSYA